MKKLKFIFYLLIVLSLIILVTASHIIYKRINAYDEIKLKLQNILAYTSFPSYVESQEIPVFYHASHNCSAQLYRLDEKLIPAGPKIQLSSKIQNPNYSPVKGFNWDSPYLLSTKGLKSGYYLFKIKSDKSKEEFNLPIIITPSRSYKIAVIANTNTWQAYNTFGGRSYYTDYITPPYILPIYNKFPSLKPLSFLPFNRPYKEISEEFKNQYNSFDNFDKLENIKDFKLANLGSTVMRGEWNLLGFFAKNKIDYGVYSDFDFCSNPNLNDADIIFFHIHSEYWSEEMIGRLNQLIEKNKKIIFLSGNNMYREIEYTEYGIIVTKESIEENKTRSLCGAYYTDPVFPKIAAYRVINENHWVFEGCNLNRGSIFGKMGASGNETDKIGFNTKGFNLLAVGTNYSGPAYMVIKENDNGGFVFNASSIMFAKCLQKDTIINKIVLNLIKHN